MVEERQDRGGGGIDPRWRGTDPKGVELHHCTCVLDRGLWLLSLLTE